MEHRQTFQKNLILTTLREECHHASAEEIVAAVQRRCPTISRATVFRNLKSFAENGQLLRIATPCGADRFDHRTEPHVHVRCRHCGRLEDCPPVENVVLPEMSDNGYRLEECELTVVGICPTCQNLSKN